MHMNIGVLLKEFRSHLIFGAVIGAITILIIETESLPKDLIDEYITKHINIFLIGASLFSIYVLIVMWLKVAQTFG